MSNKYYQNPEIEKSLVKMITDLYGRSWTLTLLQLLSIQELLFGMEESAGLISEVMD